MRENTSGLEVMSHYQKKGEAACQSSLGLCNNQPQRSPCHSVTSNHWSCTRVKTGWVAWLLVEGRELSGP